MELEILVRAVIEDRGQFLIAHTMGASNTYLPGGHCEAGEGIKHALARELREELGIAAKASDYLGVVEHAWQDSNGQNHEINHLFKVTSSELSADDTPVPLEDHIEFLWLNPDEFDKHNLQPMPLRQLLMKWESGSHTIGWASTIEPGVG
jgi:8-oxo-dGTP pyrophosphatase MutT (NUDIX family)